MPLRRFFRLLFNSASGAHAPAIEAACKAFAESHEEDYHNVSVIGNEDGYVYVRFCYAIQKPQRRAFYCVDESGAVRELTLDDVRKFGELPWA